MKQSIISLQDQPAELEKLYRKNKVAFRQEFAATYDQIKDQPWAIFWQERLSYKAESITWGSFKEWRFVVLATLIAGVYAKFPAIFDLKEDYFYPRNISFLVFPFLTAYFTWKNQLSAKSIVTLAGILLISLLYINVLPENETSDIWVLVCMHLPILLWAVLGYSFVGKSSISGRLAFLRYNGDTLIMGGLLLLGGGILTGVTLGLFSLIGLDIGEFYMNYIAVFGLASAPLIATQLTQSNPQLINKVSPVIARIFSPLVLVMLVIYLGAIVFSGKDPYNDREFLLLFNVLLIGVMGLIFFSVAETSEEEKSRSAIWILSLLSWVTIVVNAVALSAIAFRISIWGFTPNRTAVLGINILMLIHLLRVSRTLMQVIRGKEPIAKIGKSIVEYLPIYVIWVILVAFIFPLIFGF
jgi:hypothetical protein